MAEMRTIARPYAEAAFGIAAQEKALAHWSESLANLSRLACAPEMTEIIGNPAVSPAKLVELMASAVPSITKSERELLAVIVENERLFALPEVSALFEELRNQAENTLFAQVTSAFPMSEAQVADLITLLEQKHGKKVKASVAVDPELIGGVSIAIGDEVFDASVRGKLARMATALMN
jgi:F-type H+-transporting ATPase subunit delta